jgi:hypothetical protein
MRESITLAAPSYLPSLVGSRQQGNSLLALLSDKTGLAAATGDPDAAADLGLTSPSRQGALVTAEPQARRDIARFTEALAAADTPAQLLGNPIALRVLLTSHGLADQAGNSALAMRALLSNPARSNSVLNQLKDPRWLAVNDRYSFAAQGLAVLRNPATVAAICDSYAEALRVTALVKAPPAASGALAFPQDAARAETG